ncbi:MAG TPA: hypothetical protein VFZ59_23925 [Verrucomicrobiae bacterium]|nr:hypothetical protein [Verrucomicrobiae bacterium]
MSEWSGNLAWTECASPLLTHARFIFFVDSSRAIAIGNWCGVLLHLQHRTSPFFKIMSGQINFALTMDNAQAISATQQTLTAVNAFKGLRISSQDISDAFRRSATEAREKLSSLGKSAEGARAAMGGLGASLQFFGAQMNSQVVNTVTAATAGIMTIKQVSDAARISLLAAGGAASVFAAAIFAVSKAANEYEKMKAAQAFEGVTLDNSNWQQQQLLKRVKAGLLSGEMSGAVAPEEVKAWEDVLSRNLHPDVMRRQIKRLTEFLEGRGVSFGTSDVSALEAYESTAGYFRSRLGGDRASKEFDIRQEAGRQLKEALKVATASGKPYEPLRDDILKWRDQQIAELDKEKPAADLGLPRPGASPFDASGRLTGLERMGLVLQSGVMGGLDPNRSTEQNTRQTVSELKTTNKLLGKLSSPDHANI